jgi:hypothetical protein
VATATIVIWSSKTAQVEASGERIVATKIRLSKRARQRLELTLFVSFFGAVGCSGVLAKGDGRAIGDDLGRFQIDATLGKSTCGPEALGAPADFRLNVFFSVAPPRVYWNSGADSVEGDLGPDGTHFSFESETVVAVPGAKTAATTCTMVRTDTSSGDFDDAKSARSLEGSLEYRFATQGLSDCSAAMAVQGFSMLPCTMSYRMNGAWVSAR